MTVIIIYKCDQCGKEAPGIEMGPPLYPWDKTNYQTPKGWYTHTPLVNGDFSLGVALSERIDKHFCSNECYALWQEKKAAKA